MVRLFTAGLLAFVLSLLALGAAEPAFAAGPYYKAELAAPSSAERVLARDLVWKCGASICVAGKSNSRAATDCAGLARRVGALRAFAVEGRALSAAELEKCNSGAR